MIKILAFISFIFPSELGYSLHKYYTSITQIEWNEKEMLAEIIINVFIDDFEKALTEQNKYNVIYGDKNFEKCALNYVNSHFTISSTNYKQIPVKLIGIQISKDIASIYIEAGSIKTLNNCTLKNSMLTDIIESQTNLINIIEGKNKCTFLFSKSHSEETIHF